MNEVDMYIIIECGDCRCSTVCSVRQGRGENGDSVANATGRCWRCHRAVNVSLTAAELLARLHPVDEHRFYRM